MKKVLSTVVTLTLLAGLVACGGTEDGTETTVPEDGQTQDTEGTDDGLGDDPVTLTIVGVGTFAGSGPDGSIDAITGRETPGYNTIVDAWNDEHPNAALDIEAYPWDNWQASIQTAVLAGGVDVIMHGATLTDLVIPLNDFLDQDPDTDAALLSRATRRSEALGSLENVYVTGIPVTVAPMLVMLNRNILENYGLDLPEEDWTWDDLLNIAEQTTGTDPVTGEETYGLLFHDSSSDNQIWKNFANIAYGLGADPIVQYGATAKESTLNYVDDNAMQVWNFIDDLVQFTSPADREGIDPSQPEMDLNIAIYFTEGPIWSYKQLEAGGVLDQYYPTNLPVISSGELTGEVTPYFGDTNLAISNTSENTEWAWEYIKFNVTNETAITYYVENGGIANNIDELSALADHISQEWIDAVSRSMSNIPSTYSPASGLYTNNISFGNINASIGSSMRMLLMETGSAEDAAESVQQVVDEYFSTLR